MTFAFRAACAALALSIAPLARADDKTTYAAGCMDGKQFDAGLCYKRCNAGYHGVGPVCWADCPAGYHDDGATCRQALDTIVKKSHGRGAGSALGCGGGLELNGALCYPACKARYHGVGPVCWEQCDDGWHDLGALCSKGLHVNAKKSYGRGVGKPISSCPAGQDKDGALCYPACEAGMHGVGPVCWQVCPSGYTDTGAFCSKGGKVVARQSQTRGAGTIPPLCTSQSITRPVPAASGPSTFTMLFASDTQLPWWRGAHDPACNTDACVLDKGMQTNREQVAAMNAIEQAGGGKWPAGPGLTAGAGAAIKKPEGLVVNGDLTAFWHDWQVDLFEELYTNPASLKLPLFPGLGNHDIANNFHDCYWLRDLDVNRAGKNGCAQNAANWVKSAIHCNKVENFKTALVQSFDQGSLAYSWNIGTWHFVQLHNRPDYDQPDIGVHNAFAWLKADLAAATKAGRKSVLNMHDFGEHMPQNEPRFLDAIKGQRVVAIFAGHIHEQSGRIQPDDASFAVPIFRSGASEYQTFLLAEFAEDHLNVASISSAGGVAKFAEPGNADRLRTIPVAAH
jgi:cytolysin (calcineurin-like family phosphatase)